MILKSYIVEQDVRILNNYRATLIYGENKGIQDDVKEKIKIQGAGSELTTLFESDLLKNDLLNEKVSNQSLFSTKKIIFIQEVSDKIFDLAQKSLEKENDDVKIFLFANKLEKRSKLRGLFEKDKQLAIIPCYEDNARTLVVYVNDKLKGYKGLSGEITNLIISNSNMDRRVIKNELRKITSYFKQKQINKDQIQEILNIQNDPNFNEIKDRALMGEKNKVNQLLSRTDILYDEVFLYLNTLNNRITRLHEINKMADGKKNYDEIIEKLKPPVFWKDKPMMVNQLKKWGQKQLEELLIKIGETEILMKKNSHLRNDVIIKNLIVNLTNKNITSF